MYLGAVQLLNILVGPLSWIAFVLPLALFSQPLLLPLPNSLFLHSIITLCTNTVILKVFLVYVVVVALQICLPGSSAKQ